MNNAILLSKMAKRYAHIHFWKLYVTTVVMLKVVRTSANVRYTNKKEVVTLNLYDPFSRRNRAMIFGMKEKPAEALTHSREIFSFPKSVIQCRVLDFFT